MATPTKKAEAIEGLLTNTFGFDRRDSIKQDKCVPPPIGCGKPLTGFRDELSKKEYSITGLCQDCQDKLFGH